MTTATPATAPGAKATRKAGRKGPQDYRVVTVHMDGRLDVHTGPIPTVGQARKRRAIMADFQVFHSLDLRIVRLKWVEE